MKIPFNNFEIVHELLKSEMQNAFDKVYKSNWFILGNEVNEFERNYANFNQVKNCVGVSNGLDALHLSLKVLNIGNGDEVILPANTYIATALAVTYVGATPIFVEPNESTYNLDSKNIEQAITSKTKAIMPVHLYGQSCEMEEIMKIAKSNNLCVIEDNAQAQGASFKGKLTGTWGDINGTSFYPGKNLGALGDAGAITTDSDELMEIAKKLRNYGSEVKYVHDTIGYNMRLDEMQAAFLNVKLKYLNNWTLSRQEIADWYNEALSGIEKIILPQIAEGASHVYHLYVIRTNQRDELQKHLTSTGIGTLIHYPIPPHLQKAYSELGYKKGDFPISELLADTSLSLPIWPGMTFEQINYIKDCIIDFFNANKI